MRVAQACLASQFGGLQFSIDHVFSSELDKDKRVFLRDLMRPKQLFGDVGGLAGGRARNLSRCSDNSEGGQGEGGEGEGGVEEDISSVNLVVAGFPCKDVSSLNRSSAKSVRVISQMNGKTGATFSKIIRYQAKHKQLANMSLYENVPGLAKAPRANGHVLTCTNQNWRPQCSSWMS